MRCLIFLGLFLRDILYQSVAFGWNVYKYIIIFITCLYYGFCKSILRLFVELFIFCVVTFIHAYARTLSKLRKWHTEEKENHKLYRKLAWLCFYWRWPSYFLSISFSNSASSWTVAFLYKSAIFCLFYLCKSEL